MNIFLSKKGYSEEESSLASLSPKTRTDTLQFLFRGSPERPAAWQTKIVDEVLKNVWTAKKKGHIALFSQEITSSVARQSAAELTAQIVNQLHFEDLTDREYRISAAHQDTFSWIFAGPNERHIRKWTLFTSWLRCSDRLYWITGKPGSGKSTMMKYVSRDPRTRQNLLSWSGELRLITAHFYFWNSGAPMQMSLEGFYRTVIHAILSEMPRLLPDALPHRWTTSKLFGGDMRDWSMQELHQAFEFLLSKSGLSYRLCIFIDGLDEYEGDHDSFVEQLSTIALHHDVKMCIASRPWPVFELAFSTVAHLMLQDLTYPDIVRFTWSRLSGHRGFQYLVATEMEFAGNLVLEISDKAQGVFLWVSLVTKSLLTGLTNADRVVDLQQRLEELPGDLEELYYKMFNSIEPFYRAHASQYFQIALAATGQLSALAFFFADEDPRFALEPTTNPLSDSQRQDRYEIIKTRLAGCCKGFLEIANPAPAYELDLIPENLASDNNDLDAIGDNENRTDPPMETITQHGPICKDQDPPTDDTACADRKVTYLHRTAKDFLESPKMRQQIVSMSGPGFNPYVSILSAYIMLIKTYHSSKVNRESLWLLITNFLEFAATAESSTMAVLTRYLDILDVVVAEVFRKCNLCMANSHWTTTRGIAPGTQREVGFLALVAEYNLKKYIHSKLAAGMNIFEAGGGRPILDYVIEDYEIYPSLGEVLEPLGMLVPSLALVRTLLARGENPNSKYNDTTTWTRLLDTASKVAKNPHMEDEHKSLLLGHWAQMVEAFIAHEADPLQNRNSPLLSKLREVFGPLLPQKAKDLEAQLKQTKRKWASIGKFITPRNWRLERLTIESTPLPVLMRLDSVAMAPQQLSERFGSHGRNHGQAKIQSVYVDGDISAAKN
jgi:hypothetical protein